MFFAIFLIQNALNVKPFCLYNIILKIAWLHFVFSPFVKIIISLTKKFSRRLYLQATDKMCIYIMYFLQLLTSEALFCCIRV